MLETIKNFILSNSTATIVFGIVIILFIIFCFIMREKKVVKQIVYNGIVLAETKFNSGDGQKKLEFATNYIQLQLPKWLSFIISKSLIVTMIEFVLNKTSDIFQLDYTVDIIGNDDVKIDPKINIDNINKKIDAEITVSKPIGDVKKSQD